jgi:hypothetical protein
MKITQILFLATAFCGSAAGDILTLGGTINNTGSFNASATVLMTQPSLYIISFVNEVTSESDKCPAGPCGKNLNWAFNVSSIGPSAGIASGDESYSTGDGLDSTGGGANGSAMGIGKPGIYSFHLDAFQSVFNLSSHANFTLTVQLEGGAVQLLSSIGPVSLVPTPEPSTYLLLIGASIVPLVRRRAAHGLES